WLDRYEAERRPVALRLVRSTDRVFEAVTSESAVARLVRQRAVPVVGPVIVRTIPRISGASRFFEYLSQIRVHYWLRPGSGGRRGRVVGRRLPWIGENFAPLRDLTWQVHAYGKYDKPTAQRIERELALPVHTFGGTAGTLLREGLFYLVRPDGFVAAAATAPAAVEAFRRELPINTQFVAST
ncbi:MAG: monooxygenase, FAD-binding protein, partial [Actinomycetia bacterium]|nr:monooxygenase, FAD-binding protein [Actinomycetes bacterium]